MRIRKISALALVVTAAGFSLAACDGGDGSAAASAGSAPTAASGSTAGQGSTPAAPSPGSATASSPGSAGGPSTGSGTGSRPAGTRPKARGAMCRTDTLAFSAASAGVRNEIVVNLKNTGSGTCSMHGFPGVQLVGPDGLGDVGPDAARTDATVPTVTIAPGEETRFLLRWIPDTSGSGKTWTRLSVTPPNETVSEIVDLHGQDITVAAPSGEAPDVYVDPVGYHVGSGK